MDASDVANYARQLLDAHGDKAEFEAAQKARAAEEGGDAARAGQWQRVRKAIAEMRAAHQS